DDLVSAVPRAFVLPLLSALLWALVTRRTLLASAVVVFLGLFYPMGGALGVAILALGLIRLGGWRPSLSGRRTDWVAFGGAAVLVGLTLLQGQIAGARYGPVVTAAEAQAMPDFGPNG